ncbi:unnamed protein product, partial [marine sediment metagenome]
PFIDKIVNPLIVDESTQIAALRTGAIDLQTEAGITYEDTLKGSCPELIMKGKTGTMMYFLSLNVTKEPYSNKEVRRALMIALDREAIGEALFPGGDVYSGWPVGKSVFGVYTPIDELPPETQELFEYDPDLAKDMIADEYPEGLTGLEIVTKPGFDADIASMILAYWADIGVEGKVLATDAATYSAMIRTNEHQCHISTQGINNPISALSLQYMPPFTKSNPAMYENPDFTKRYEEAVQIVNAVERKAMLKELTVFAIDTV